jgi:hypothetical protein
MLCAVACLLIAVALAHGRPILDHIERCAGSSTGRYAIDC